MEHLQFACPDKQFYPLSVMLTCMNMKIHNTDGYLQLPEGNRRRSDRTSGKCYGRSRTLHSPYGRTRRVNIINKEKRQSLTVVTVFLIIVIIKNVFPELANAVDSFRQTGKFFLHSYFVINTFRGCFADCRDSLCKSSLCSSFIVFLNCSFYFLMEVLTAERIDLFLAALVLFTKILFFADLMLANWYTSISDL